MFARTLEGIIKLEKKTEFLRKVREEVLPILKKQDGFLDILGLEGETEQQKFFAITLWHEKRDEERYERETYPKVKAIIEPFLTTPVMIKLYKVETSISERILAVAA